MKKGLIGKKIGMTQIFDEKGNVIPVTVVEAGPCAVVQKKTVENDGYKAVQMGYGDQKAQRVNKPMKAMRTPCRSITAYGGTKVCPVPSMPMLPPST